MEGELLPPRCSGGVDGPSGELVGEEELVEEWLSMESSSGQDSSISLSEVTLLSRDIMGREAMLISGAEVRLDLIGRCSPHGYTPILNMIFKDEWYVATSQLVAQTALGYLSGCSLN